MRSQTNSASRAITDYFNSPAWSAPQESDLLAAIMRELMASGQPTTNKAIVARVIEQLEIEDDEKRLQSYRNLLAQLIEARQQDER